MSRYFWDSARERRLVYQRCANCRAAVFPPRARCNACWADALRWSESGGLGGLASTAVVHRPGHPAFAALAPYPLALVDLDEGFRMLSRLVTEPDRVIPVGARVRVRWERTGDTTLPLFVDADPGRNP